MNYPSHILKNEPETSKIYIENEMAVSTRSEVRQIMEILDETVTDLEGAKAGTTVLDNM